MRSVPDDQSIAVQLSRASSIPNDGYSFVEPTYVSRPILFCEFPFGPY